MSVLNKGQITTGVVTFAIALGVGHLTQYGFSGSEEFQQPAPRPSAARPARPNIGASSVMMQSPLLPVEHITPDSRIHLPEDPDIARETHDPASLLLDPIDVPEDAAGVPAKQDQVRLQGFGRQCDVQLAATPQTGALIELEVVAPCDPETRLEISHASLSFHSKTDMNGHASLTVPALATEADVSVSIQGRDVAVQDVTVPDALWYDRFAVTWTGDDALSLRLADSGEDVSLMRLGVSDLQVPRLAAVLSYPSTRMQKAGLAPVSLTAKVTDETCSRTIPVRLIQTVRGEAPLGQQLSVAFPGCDATGQTLVLKNILEDRKIARN